MRVGMYVVSQPLVAPREGAWIEINATLTLSSKSRVAPREGAWIEINKPDKIELDDGVAPREGAWIEIIATATQGRERSSRAP